METQTAPVSTPEAPKAAPVAPTAAPAPKTFTMRPKWSGGAPAAPPASVAATVATETPPAQVEAAPKVDADDDLASALARLNENSRKASLEEKRYREDRAKLKSLAERGGKLDAVAEKLKNRQYLQVLRDLDEGFNPNQAVLEMLEQVDSLAPQPLTQAQVEEMVAKKTAADRQAEEEAAKTKREQELASARAGYFDVALKAFDQTKHKLISKIGVTQDELVKWVDDHYDKTKIVLSPSEALDGIEASMREKVKAAGFTLQEAVAGEVKPVNVGLGSSAMDTGGQETAAPRPMTLAEKVEAAKKKAIARLNA